MKNTNIKIFLFLEGLLLLLLIFQLVREWGLLLPLLTGLLLVKANTGQRTGMGFWGWLGWFLIAISVLSTFSIWLMLGLALGFFLLSGSRILEDFHVESVMQAPWKKKRYMGIQTREPESRDGRRQKQKWVGNRSIGNEVFEWDDINISVLMGDTIIDLGNTLLPMEENIILLRKGMGQTRIIVPVGIGVSLHHSALAGTVEFAGEHLRLANETVKLYSKDYDHATRKVKIVSNVGLGDFEVIYL